MPDPTVLAVLVIPGSSTVAVFFFQELGVITLLFGKVPIDTQLALLKPAAVCNHKVYFLIGDMAAVVPDRRVFHRTRYGALLFFLAAQLVICQQGFFLTARGVLGQGKGNLRILLRQGFHIKGCCQLMLPDQVVQCICYRTPRQQRFGAASQVRALPDKQPVLLPVEPHAGVTVQQKFGKDILVAVAHKAQPINRQRRLLVKGKVICVGGAG